MFEMIPLVQAVDLPREVEDWCIDREISTHYNNDVAIVKDDGNPFAVWLKENGHTVGKYGFFYVGIIGS